MTTKQKARELNELTFDEINKKWRIKWDIKDHVKVLWWEVYGKEVFESSQNSIKKEILKDEIKFLTDMYIYIRNERKLTAGLSELQWNIQERLNKLKKEIENYAK